jgi:hypothetical protein
MKPIKGWHFLPEGRRLRYGDGRVVQVGKVYRWSEGTFGLCDGGMHMSRNILDALRYAPGPILCRVESVGRVIEGGDKLVAEGRKVLWLIDATDVLRAFDRRCALDVVHVWDAPDVVVRYLKTGDESLRSAAWSAAPAVARHAARYAARSAATAAADAAAGAAAGSAAGSAARAAASYAADAAADAAAGAAARAAARARQSRRLVQMAVAEHRRVAREGE